MFDSFINRELSNGAGDLSGLMVELLYAIFLDKQTVLPSILLNVNGTTLLLVALSFVVHSISMLTSVSYFGQPFETLQTQLQ